MQLPEDDGQGGTGTAGDLSDEQAGGLRPGLQIVGGESEAAVGVVLTQELERVRREVDDQNAPIRAERTCDLAQSEGRVVGEVQDLVEHGEID